ncbi:type VII secretion protein EccCa [Saccharopolyspora indica]|uniref:type VII secretion protein EccCa n=1 Tax=Saccharopolyspora indica TaxID=1229659 RepID=UPI002FE591EB
MQPPPELPKPNNENTWLVVLPALSGLGSVVYIFSIGRSPIGYVAGSMFVVSALAMVVGSLLRQRSGQQGELRVARRDFLRHLAKARREVRNTAQVQRDSLEWNSPDPSVLWSVAESPRLWERRPADADFGVLRIGTGPRYLNTPLVPAESAPVEEVDPLSAVALKRFVETQSTVVDLPVQLALRRFAAITFGGDRAAERALVRAMIAHAITLHPPKDLRVLICTGAPDGREWGWAKWLPHTWHPDDSDHVGPVRMVQPGLLALEDWLGAELTRRPRFNRRTDPDPELPHLLVVLDGGTVVGSEAVLDAHGLQAVTVLDLDGHAAELAAAHGLRLEVRGDELAVRAGEVRDPIGKPDGLSAPELEALARQVARFRLDVATAQVEDLTTADQTLPGLLGVGDPGRLDLPQLWRPRPMRDRLRVPVGVNADGGLLEIDIKEAAQEGMGPHGLVVGATGSGKSELLRTLVLAMATTHSPEQLNLVLVDFKGGATFAGMSELPHVAAVITNLEDDLGLVDRMQEALAGEMNRRQEVLRDAGNMVSVRDYERARQRGADLPPLPSLFIVVDEFSELLAQKPDFAELFVQIGRLGRSLGLHLLLASQRLEEGRLRGLEAHLSYRIGLRTFSEQESRTAIGVVDAHHLPNSPGHGYLRTDTTTLRRFRSAYVSGAYRSGDEQDHGGLAGEVGVRPFTAAVVPIPAEQQAPAPEPELAADEFGEEESLQRTVLSVMVEQMTGRGAQAHQVWLPPLDVPEPLGALYPDLEVREGRGFGASPRRPLLEAVLGVEDKPFHQRRDPLLLDLSGAGGHVGVVGGPRTGKSTAIRTLVLSLALRHTPAEVQFFCLDFSGTLFGLKDLPHVSGIAGRLDSEVVNRVVAEVVEILEDRELRFREIGVDSMAGYRELRAQGELPEERFGDVFVVVDGWHALRQTYEELEQTLMQLAGRMLSYGIHLVVSGNRWMDLRMGLRDLIGTKIEFKLGDALDSEIDRKVQLGVPTGRPGRGISASKHHFLTAVPELADGGTAELVERIDAAWPGPRARKVRLLPTCYEFAEIPAEARARGVVLGMEGKRLEPVVFAPGRDNGAILIGDNECGKTSTLRSIATQVVTKWSPEQAKLIVLDYRMSMLREFDGPQLLGYSTTHQHSLEVISGLVDGFQRRLPGPEVTPEQLRNRSWWSGPEIFLLVDDYDLVATSVGNPLLPLLDLLPQARSIGLNLYIARQAGGAARATTDPLLNRMRELNFPGILMSIPKDETGVWGHRPQTFRPGRGLLLHRRLGNTPIQLARLDSQLGAVPGG